MDPVKKQKKQDRNHLFDLYDNILQDVQQKQLESNLKNFIESQRLYDEIVNKGKQKIDQQYHDLKKQEQTKIKIYKSSMINRHHMMKAELRFKMCEEVFDSVLHQIQQKIQQDKEEHSLFLIKLIVEGALRMFQPQLHIRCLPKHIQIVEQVIKASQQTFNHVMKQQTGRNYPIKLIINRSDYLDERQVNEIGHLKQFTKKQEDHQCVGGVILSDPSGNITYKNTIDARINILKEICLPIIRTELWPNMKQSIQNGKVL